MAVFKKRKKRHGFAVFLVLLAILAVLLYDGNTRIVTQSFELGNARLPESFEGFKIVQLSDLHTSSFGEGNIQLLDAVREQQPDIIAVTGDLIDGDRAEDYVIELMSRLSDIAPVYYVSGNHEWASGWIQELFEILDSCGVTVLRNEYVVLQRGGQDIVLAGIDDPNGPYDQKTPAELVGEIRAEVGDSYILMLAHRNDEIDMWADLGVDAVLCGHAHGGVIRLPFTDGLIAPGMEWFPTYTSGIYVEGGTQMLVSRGLGNTRGTFRLFNNPQIVTAVLTKK
ncbi:MAG: metallophosphoesterase [Oscillospiraceae bacterium]